MLNVICVHLIQLAHANVYVYVIHIVHVCVCVRDSLVHVFVCESDSLVHVCHMMYGVH